MRLIDADAVVTALIDADLIKWQSQADRVQEVIDTISTIEPKHGRWIYDGKGGYGLYKCSECNEFWSHWYADVIPIERMNKILKFCPNCGAKMDEESDIDENWYSDEYRTVGENEMDEVEDG